MSSTLTLLSIAIRRLRTSGWLAWCALAALTMAVALAVAIPVYAEAAGLRLLREALERQEQRSGRPAFALLIRYLGSWGEPLDWERVAPADGLVGEALEHVGLPVERVARHVRTAAMPLAASGDGAHLIDGSLGFVAGMDDQIRVVDGSMPQPAASPGDPLEVLIARALANRVGLNVGDELTAIGRSSGRSVGVPVRIAGLWEPLSPDDPTWFYPPEALDQVLLLAEADFAGPLAATLTGEVDQALWFARLDGAGLNAATAGALVRRIDALGSAVAGALPGTRLEQSPAGALGQYQRDSAALTAQLVVFGAPIAALVLSFVAMVGGLMLRRQAPEIALLKTRGVRDSQILGLVALEWLTLGTVALALGAPLGLAFAVLMSRTSSFLRLDPALPELRLVLTPTHLTVGAAAVAAALLAVLLPALSATRRTLTDVQQAAARPEAPAFWQRRWLDLLLLPLPLYGVYQLHAGGGPLLGAGAGRDLTANPLLVLVPALLSLSLGLIFLRLLPPLLELTVRAAARRESTALVVALRTLARQPGDYRGPLLLLILTLSLAIFSAAAATALDDAMIRGVTYNVGAAAQLIETGESTETVGPDGRPERHDIEEEPRFLFLPVEEHLDVPGITAASRVGRYTGRIAGTTAQLVGVDRHTMPQVLRGFNPAWAGGTSLGELMNRLATQPAGALVGPELLERGVRIGDRITVSAELFGDRRDIDMIVVGVVELFPGFYPQEGPLVLTNLDYLFDQMGGQYPYDVWIDYAPGADVAAIAAGVRALGVDLVEVRDVETLLRAEQARPQRQGLFGLLSIGFVGSGSLTVLGFLAATAITARRRLVELGVLRAMGMPSRSATAVLGIEQVIIVAAGLIAGVAIGLLGALLVVPMLQVGVGPHPGTPPGEPRVAWAPIGIAAISLAAAVILALGGLGTALRRARLFAIVKMGDSN